MAFHQFPLTGLGANYECLLCLLPLKEFLSGCPLCLNTAADTQKRKTL